MSFASLGLGPNLTRAVDDAGYEHPTPIQKSAIPAILAGRDLIGVAQTGTGKTAAFLLPMLERIARKPEKAGTRILVLAPTRELAVQLEESLHVYAKHLRIRSVCVYGGVSENPQIETLQAGADVIIATPGRLLDLAGQGYVRFDALQFLVLDEGDRMLDMGFLPSIRRIIRMLPAKRQTLLFSATFGLEIERIASEFLIDPLLIEASRRATPAETVSHVVHHVAADQKVDLLVHLLRSDRLSSVLVFSRTRHGADKLARKLVAAGLQTATIHSDRSQAQRLRALTRFRNGEVRVLVATDLAARGIDVDGISHVINYDFPAHPEDYIHRIGRTGRAEASGEAISFVTSTDYPNLHRVEQLVGRRIDRIPAEGFAARHDHTPPVIPTRESNTMLHRSFRPRVRTRP